MTLAGLTTVNLSALNFFQQFILFALIMLGSAIFVSLTAVHIRRRAFEQRLKNNVNDQHRQQKGQSDTKQRSNITVSHPKAQTTTAVERDALRGGAVSSSCESTGANSPKFNSLTNHIADETCLSVEGSNHIHGHLHGVGDGSNPGSSPSNEEDVDVSAAPRIRFAAPIPPSRAPRHARFFEMRGVGARQDVMNNPSQSSLPIYPIISVTKPETKLHGSDFFSITGFVGRNSQFSSLTLAERERLGGVEYRAVTFLAVVVPLYFVLWQIIGSLGLGAYIAKNRPKTTLENGLNPWYIVRQ